MSAQYGIFILNNRSWRLHATYSNESAARTELAYLVNVLGINAKLFKRA